MYFDIFIYTMYVGSDHFLGFKVLIFLYFGGFEEFGDIFWGHHKIGLVLGVISMHYRVFFKAMVQNGVA